MNAAEETETHILCSKTFSENRTVCEIIWKNIVQPDRPQMTIWRKKISFWILKTTNTHSEHVIHIDFPLQHWLHERA
jgi:hypothetical protein